MTLKEKIKIVTDNRDKLTDGQKKAVGAYKSMMRNIADEGGRIGGESHVSVAGIKQFEALLDKCINSF
jgi:hypothetical protein